MDRLVVVKVHTNIANRWLFMIQRKIMAISFSIHKVIWTCLGGPFFPDTVYTATTSLLNTELDWTQAYAYFYIVFRNTVGRYVTRHTAIACWCFSELPYAFQWLAVCLFYYFIKIPICIVLFLAF